MAMLWLFALVAMGRGAEQAAQVVGVSWGIYDFSLDPGGGWQLATSKQIETLKHLFVPYYNSRAGLPIE